MRWEYKIVLVLLEVLFLSTIVIVAAIHAGQPIQVKKCGEGGLCPVEYNTTALIQKNNNTTTQLVTKNATATAKATTKTSNKQIKATATPVIKPTPKPSVVQAKYVPTSTPKPTPTPVPVKKVTIIFFYQDGCPACVQMEPIINQVALKYPVTWVNLSTDKATGAQYGITNTPTTLVNGKALVGVVSYDTIIGAIG